MSRCGLVFGLQEKRRRNRGIIRSSAQPEYVDTAKRAMTLRVLDNYRRLKLWLKVCGLWRWRRVALSLQELVLQFRQGRYRLSGTGPVL